MDIPIHLKGGLNMATKSNKRKNDESLTWLCGGIKPLESSDRESEKLQREVARKLGVPYEELFPSGISAAKKPATKKPAAKKKQPSTPN